MLKTKFEFCQRQHIIFILTFTQNWECRGRSPVPGARGRPSFPFLSYGPQARESHYELIVYSSHCQNVMSMICFAHKIDMQEMQFPQTFNISSETLGNEG